MAYRDDLEAANARISQLEDQLRETQKAQCGERDEIVRSLQDQLEGARASRENYEVLLEKQVSKNNLLTDQLKNARRGYIKGTHAILIVLANIIAAIAFSVALYINDDSEEPRNEPRTITIDFDRPFSGDIRGLSRDRGPYWELYRSAPKSPWIYPWGCKARQRLQLSREVSEKS